MRDRRGIDLSRNAGLVEMITQHFDRDTLARICAMGEREFAAAYGMETVRVRKTGPDFYAFKDNGSDILAVAHLDTVGLADERTARFVDTEGGTVVFSRALDDRLGAYIILELLPALGITYDVLLTVGEETGQSTAEFFQPSKDYNWMIEFDRGGSDVVLYQYDDEDTANLVLDSGADVADGIFSDISYMEHLGIKGFNWGVGYQDYHGPRAHAFLDDTFEMVAYYLDFHAVNADVALPHKPQRADDLWFDAADSTWGRASTWADAKYSWDRSIPDDDVLDDDVPLWSNDSYAHNLARINEILEDSQ